MKTKNITMGLVAAVMMASVPMDVRAQDKVEASVGADLVSGYVWRGQDLGGVSIQPSVSVAYKGFSLGAWGSVGIDKEDAKEFDLTFGYGIGGFSVSVTDYWVTGGEGYFMYDSHRTAHVFGAQVGYDFGPVAVNWYTNFAGADYCKYDGDRAYSSYISVTAPFKLGGIDWTAEIGATPWETSYYNVTDEYPGSNGFTVCDVALSAGKEIKITNSFSIPAFVKVSVNPRTQQTHFVFGLSF